jgi:lipoprotein-anchoring transpeptidase ErfK/SrfK
VPGFGRRTTIVLTSLASLLLVAAAGMAWATLDYTNDHDGRLLPGASIAGVDVGALDRQEALDAVASAIQPQLDRTVTVEWAKRSWTVTPRDLGARNNAEAVVDQGLAAARATSFLDRMKMRVFGDAFDFERDIAITYPKKGVRGFIGGVAAGLDLEARDATVDYETGWVEVVPEREGRKVLRKRSRLNLMAALKSGSSTADLEVKPVLPTATTEDFRQVLLVRIGENKLYLYEDGEITHHWKVATGLPEYATPTGIYEVTELRYLPTWVNPAPDTWGANMPAEIPPGPGNPLGLRAINWSAEAIRFHGTSATYSLGFNASHGCVRMSNEDVVKLYDMIEVGTPIVSTVVAPLKPLYASAPDPIVVAEDEGKSRPSTDDDERKSSGGDN